MKQLYSDKHLLHNRQIQHQGIKHKVSTQLFSILDIDA